MSIILEWFGNYESYAKIENGVETHWPRYKLELYDDSSRGVTAPDLEDKEKERLGFNLKIMNRFWGYIVKVGEDSIGNIYQTKKIAATLMMPSIEYRKDEWFISPFLFALKRIIYDIHSRNLTLVASDDRKLKFIKIKSEQ